jgi:transcriptional regulator with XRE-family HTH domain
MTGSARRRGTGKVDPLQARALRRLNDAVQDLGLTQSQIADRAQLTQGHVSRVLGGEGSETAFWVIARIATAIGVSLDWIVEAPPAPKAKSEPPAATGTDPRR